jgi:GNAT superfamily N-acetyltransferase
LQDAGMNQIVLPKLQIHAGYQPGVIGRIVELHGRYYAGAWGVGAAFETMTARALCDFLERSDPAKDLFLTAHVGSDLIGSLAVEGRVGGADSAQIRFVIVDDAHRGHGAGKALLSQALAWAHRHGFVRLFLWTVDHLPAARRLYEGAGFEIVERVRDSRYTAPLDSLKMEARMDHRSPPLPEGARLG